MGAVGVSRGKALVLVQALMPNPLILCLPPCSTPHYMAPEMLSSEVGGLGSS